MRTLYFCPVISIFFFFFFTGSICAQRKPAGISFTQRSILRFFAPQGRHVAPMGVKFGMEEVPSSMPNFTAIGATTRV